MEHLLTTHHSSRDALDPAPAALAAQTGAWLWARTAKLQQVWDVVAAISAWPDIVIAADRDGLCLRLRGVVLGQLRWNGRIDVPFSPEMRDRLIAEGMAARDPDEIDAEGVVFAVRTTADVDHAVWLLRLAYLNLNPNARLCAKNGVQ
jgi:hypothetical protein